MENHVKRSLASFMHWRSREPEYESIEGADVKLWKEMIWILLIRNSVVYNCRFTLKDKSLQRLEIEYIKD